MLISARKRWGNARSDWLNDAKSFINWVAEARVLNLPFHHHLKDTQLESFCSLFNQNNFCYAINNLLLIGIKMYWYSCKIDFLVFEVTLDFSHSYLSIRKDRMRIEGKK